MNLLVTCFLVNICAYFIGTCKGNYGAMEMYSVHLSAQRQSPKGVAVIATPAVVFEITSVLLHVLTETWCFST